MSPTKSLLAAILEAALEHDAVGEPQSLDEVLAIDADARRRAADQVARLAA